MKMEILMRSPASQGQQKFNRYVKLWFYATRP